MITIIENLPISAQNKILHFVNNPNHNKLHTKMKINGVTIEFVAFYKEPEVIVSWGSHEVSVDHNLNALLSDGYKS